MLRHCLLTLEGEHEFIVYSIALLQLEGSPLSFGVGIFSLFLIRPFHARLRAQEQAMSACIR